MLSLLHGPYATAHAADRARLLAGAGRRGRARPAGLRLPRVRRRTIACATPAACQA